MLPPPFAATFHPLQSPLTPPPCALPNPCLRRVREGIVCGGGYRAQREGLLRHAEHPPRRHAPGGQGRLSDPCAQGDTLIPFPFTPIALDWVLYCYSYYLAVQFACDILIRQDKVKLLDID
ncbi:hypothetical protein PR202_ga26548 [Eleusine coracana subsp. coracana]|uniref:Uncharacterized protein n=1 Tax=Eleusine coracana subsp. coracana TaxID=191504 RepID=A0AAV5DC80_ELECO|nr:hypothetical protein PR202_ga26548 [Eleusine coracana subsp. coracana]